MRTRILTKESLREEVVNLLAAIRPGNELNVHNQIKQEFLDGEASRDRFWIDYTFKADERHWNSYKIVHGGISATLLDDCVGISSGIARGLHYITTSSMALEYTRAMKGKKFRIHTEITHVGEHMVTGTGLIYDEKDRLCVSGMISYIVHTDKTWEPEGTL